MELYFGETIKRLRKNRDLTQEAVAEALGISAQSVSKWECAYGYPDITQLPAIANFFGVTIDALLANDEAGRKEVEEQFYKTLKTYESNSEEKLNFVKEYCRKYPDDLRYTWIYCSLLGNYILSWPNHRKKYEDALRATAEKLLDSPYRENVIQTMVCSCSEESLDEWLNLAPISACSNRRDLMLMRCNMLSDTEKSITCLSLSNLERMAVQLDARFPDRAGAEAKNAYHKAILATLRSFGDGEIPDGWLPLGAYKQLVYAACLFEMDKRSEGKEEFLSAIDKLRRYYGLGEEYLSTGSALFGGLRVKKDWSMAMDENGREYPLYEHGMRSMSRPRYILTLLQNPAWAWFDRERNKGYYRDAVRWLGELCETKAD